MLIFSRFLLDEGCIFKVIFLFLLEFILLEDIVDILVEYFYDLEVLDVEV